MRDERKYHCFDCDRYFGNIPAFGCPYCGSENYFTTIDEPEARTEKAVLATAQKQETFA